MKFVKRMTALAMALMFLVAANLTRVEAAPANNLTPQQIEALATEMFNRFAAFDAQGTRLTTTKSWDPFALLHGRAQGFKREFISMKCFSI